MEDPREARFDIGHPAPARDRTSPWAVAFGLFGAPLAWTLQLNANVAIGSLGCLQPNGVAGSTGSTGGAVLATIVINILAFVLAAAALAVSARDLRRTRHEERHRSGGVIGAGEGRTRFLSVWGVWISGLFIIAIGANTMAAFWRGLCAGV
jgi:hypothetical protein